MRAAVQSRSVRSRYVAWIPPGRVDDSRPGAFPGPQGPEDRQALTHDEERGRVRVSRIGDLLGVLHGDLVPAGLQHLAREAQDLRVVRLAPRRVRALTEDAPAATVAHDAGPR